MKRLIINARREGYGPEQVVRTMTVGELIQCLEDFDPDTPVYTGHDQQGDGSWYTYGGFRYTDFFGVDDEEDEEEDK